MRRSEALQGVRMIRFQSVLERYEADELNQIEAAEMLGVSERTFRRWCRRFEEEGETGLSDRRLGRPSGKRVPADDEVEIERLYRTRYQGFTARHFHEYLMRDHLYRWSYTWTKLFLQSKGLLDKAPRRGVHRRKRPRRPLPGMMLHQDGSRHAWLEGQPAMDLIVTMDDATNTIYSVKRLIGRSWASDEVQQARGRFPFELREGAKNSTLVVARGETYALPEMSAFVLRRAKAIASSSVLHSTSPQPDTEQCIFAPPISSSVTFSPMTISAMRGEPRYMLALPSTIATTSQNAGM